MRYLTVVCLLCVAVGFAAGQSAESGDDSVEVKILIRKAPLYGPNGFILMPEEARKIMASKTFTAATVEVLNLTGKWHLDKTQACERIAAALQVEAKAVPGPAVVRVSGLGRQDGVKIANELCFMLANAPLSGPPPTEKDMRAIATTNLVSTYLLSATAARGLTNTAVIEVLEYAK